MANEEAFFEQQHHTPQHACKGLLVWEESGSDVFNGTCYGVTTPLKGAYVDLVEHAQSRPAPGGLPNTTVASLACVGSAAYQHAVDPNTGTIPPPACLGVEFVRHRQAVLAAHGAFNHQHQHQQQPSSVPALAREIELLHTDQQTASSSSSADSSSSTAAEAYMRPQQQQPSTHASPVEPPVQGPEYHGRPSVLQRLQEIHAEASERLEGQDPLWFGKAFATRAAMNWESMKSMAGQVLEAAKADLGLQTKSEEPKS